MSSALASTRMRVAARRERSLSSAARAHPSFTRTTVEYATRRSCGAPATRWGAPVGCGGPRAREAAAGHGVLIAPALVLALQDAARLRIGTVRWIVREAKTGDTARIRATQIMERCRTAARIRTAEALQPSAAHPGLSRVRSGCRSSACLRCRRVERGRFRCARERAVPGSVRGGVIHPCALGARALAAARAQREETRRQQTQPAPLQPLISGSRHGRCPCTWNARWNAASFTVKHVCQSVPQGLGPQTLTHPR
jgi:hypothetical protein